MNEGPFKPDSDLTAKSKQLAQDLLDGLDQPKSPEREAYEAKKEREDRESLERFYRATGQCKATFAQALSDLAIAIESLPIEGPFKAIELELTGLPRRAVLRLAPSPRTPHFRYIELTLYTASEQSTSSVWMHYGTNAEVAAYLTRPATIAEIEPKANELMLSLERNRMA